MTQGESKVNEFRYEGADKAEDDGVREPEWFYALRRSDGEDLGDYSYVTVTKSDPWHSVAEDYEDDDEAFDIELVRMDVTVVEKRTVGGPRPLCDRWRGLEQEAGTRWTVLIPGSGEDGPWPARPYEVTTLDTIEDADAFIAALPDVAHVIAYGQVHPIERSRFSVLPKEDRAWASDCSNCGHRKEEHGA